MHEIFKQHSHETTRVLAQGLRINLPMKTAATCCPSSMLPTPNLVGTTRFLPYRPVHYSELSWKALQMSAKARLRAFTDDRSTARESSSQAGEHATILTYLDCPSGFVTQNNYELCQRVWKARHLFYLAQLLSRLYLRTFFTFFFYLIVSKPATVELAFFWRWISDMFQIFCFTT